MKELGMKMVHLFAVLAACLAISTTMVGCGDDTEEPGGADSGTDAGGTAGMGGDDAAMPGTDAAMGTDSAVPGDDAGDDAGSDAG
jgi:hypothetical protein